MENVLAKRPPGRTKRKYDNLAIVTVLKEIATYTTNGTLRTNTKQSNNLETLKISPAYRPHRIARREETKNEEKFFTHVTPNARSSHCWLCITWRHATRLQHRLNRDNNWTSEAKQRKRIPFSALLTSYVMNTVYAKGISFEFVLPQRRFRLPVTCRSNVRQMSSLLSVEDPKTR